MRISYNPTRTATRYEEHNRYVQEYILPLGRPRQAVEIEGTTLVLSGDTPGLLAMTLSLLDRAVDPMRDSLELAEVREYDPPGGWWGNFEPGSPSLDLKREGPAINLPNDFTIDTSPITSQGKASKSSESLSIQVSFFGAPRSPHLASFAAGPHDLVKLAIDCASLSQSPVGDRIVYRVAWGPDGRHGTFRIEKRRFPSDSPWGGPPSKTRESKKRTSKE